MAHLRLVFLAGAGGLAAMATAESVARLDGTITEFVSQHVDSAFGKGALVRAGVDEIRRISLFGITQIRHADAQKPVFCAVDFPAQKFKAGGEDAVGKTGGVTQLPVAGACPEILR